MEDPDLRVVAAAYLWDAAIAILESQGGAPEPRHLRDARARARVEALVRDARALVSAALRRDASVGERTPFALAIQAGGASRARPGTGVMVVTSRRRWRHLSQHARRYIPLPVMGAAHDTGGIHGPTSGGTLLQPVVTGAYSAAVRPVLFFGMSSQYGRGPDQQTFFFAGELGVGVRLGYPVGLSRSC